jgi:hypothetical protein
MLHLLEVGGGTLGHMLHLLDVGGGTLGHMLHLLHFLNSRFLERRRQWPELSEK